MRNVLKINAGIACLDRANEVEPRPNEVTIKSRESKRAESPKSIAQGNALCNELHPFPSSPERAKSFVNNRLRSEQGSVAHFQFSPVRAAELIFTRKSSGANFQFLILTCHPYEILLTATIFSTDISSLRDFLTTTTKINAGIAFNN